MNFKMDIYTPRWGHTDEYVIGLEQDKMLFKHGGSLHPPAVVTYVENRDPTWDSKAKFFAPLNNDSIYPSHAFPDALEYLWLQARNTAMDHDQIQAELDAMAEFINASTKAKPQTAFWRQYF